MKDSKSNPLVQFKASELDIKFPDNNKLNSTEKETIENSIKKGGIALYDGRCFMENRSVQTQLCTDKKGVNRFYNDLDDEDKFANGEKVYSSISSVGKEISERIQQPRDTLIHERLKHAEQCLNALRDEPTLAELRHIEEARIRKELPRLTEKKIKCENIEKCQLTGDDFDNDAEGHHIVRKADDPRRACDSDNIIVIKGDVHRTIHRENAESIEELKTLCKEEGWKNNNA